MFAWLAPIALKLLAGLAAVTAVLGAVAYVRQSGKVAERAEQLKTVARVKDAQLKVDRPSHSGLAERLRDGTF